MKAFKCAAAAFAVLGVVGSGQALAACPANSTMNHTELNSTFPGNTVCAVRGSNRWQEFHQADGALVDWKKGPADPVDPTKQVGSWSVNGTGANARMVYNYGSGGTYTYRVVSNGGGLYSFCNGDEVHDATVRPGQQSCGF